MNVNQALSLSFDEFEALYKCNNGFNGLPNINHPAHDEDETFESFVSNGCRLLLRENSELLNDMI